MQLVPQHCFYLRHISFLLVSLVVLSGFMSQKVLAQNPLPEQEQTLNTINSPKDANAPNFTRSTKIVSSPLRWRILAPHLSLGVSRVQNNKLSAGAALTIVQIDPEEYQFTLHMASENGRAMSFAAWGAEHNLIAGINASMYLQDNLTSTGYMKNKEHINNPRIGSKLGAFFVANPTQAHLPKVDILEAEDKDLLHKLRQYSLVVQNYRLSDRNKEILWQQGGTQNSIAAIAKNTTGKILFILCQEPLTPTDFTIMLQQMHLDLTTTMYVEGGTHAGLFFTGVAPVVEQEENKPTHTLSAPLDGKENTGSAQTDKIFYFTPATNADHVYCILTGKKGFLLSQGTTQKLLPNIIGISPLHKKK